MLARLLISVFAVVALTAAAASPCVAQDDDEARTAEARQLFSEGLALAEEEHYEEAAAKFRRAYQLRPAPPIAFNFGNALIASGRLVEGTEMMRQIVRDSDAPEELREDAQAVIEEAEPRLGRLVVRVTGHAEDAVIAIKGSPVDATLFGVPVSADPGLNQVTASRNREVIATAEVEVPEGGRAEVSIDVPAPPALPEPEPEIVVTPEPVEEPVDEGGSILGRWWFWTAVGVVVVGAILVGVIAASASGGVEDPIVGTTQPGVLTWE